MLARRHRLTRSRDIEFIYKKGDRKIGRFLMVRTVPNRQPTPRIGVIVSTKWHKLAVRRNRIKRIVRAEVRAWLPKLVRRQDILITAKLAPKDVNEEQMLLEELRKLFADPSFC